MKWFNQTGHWFMALISFALVALDSYELAIFVVLHAIFLLLIDIKREKETKPTMVVTSNIVDEEVARRLSTAPIGRSNISKH
ncbi:hypothetical protein HZF08_33550 [Paenibacillus sp. CGMCC 1.16610]|uniref:Uncharacterized protein n=1 Tax=Paenibacillus anseongense TaxID=2682845 RepID=A0ABW9U3A1_9BACL|nr:MULTISPECIES: hypothetical protein [Paenibacillus]MBA2943198.1 hypothetical protein [Paenibacillus sp. CGMCC 1.16610]MVQ33695.1 hypothetical protein [Paenibacillus anseongense]